ncbi:MlaD family protein [Chondromyces crocatus]|uniref:Mce/MlaD domain-containing protein n=1 Tax=Chondromyces crocatus TaxID=52 RepID=A0A0K1EPW3_CHOCO|nr:MlaD family protein [Chondromyces crocatus]AKT42682.1 uncharacterized protein CMC5_069090 [Chondromyces crocatus]
MKRGSPALLLVGLFLVSASCARQPPPQAAPPAPVAPPAPDGFRVHAVFRPDQALVEGMRVTVSGVAVGKVERLERTSAGTRAFLVLQPGIELYEDATVSVHAASLLGDQYIELELGTPETITADTGEKKPSAKVGENQEVHTRDE